MVINTNILAMNANRTLNITGKSKAKKTEKLSSGYKINRAADDAAGLTISEKLRRQIRGLTQASENTQDGVSFCQIADGALNEVQDMLKRCQQLATQAANETNSDEDRKNIQLEVKALTEAIDKVHQTSTFNDFRVFPDAGSMPDQASVNGPLVTSSGLSRSIFTGNTVFTLDFLGVDGTPATVVETRTSGVENPDSVKNSSIASFAVDAAASAVSKLAAKYPTLFSKSSSDDIQIGLELSSQGYGGTLATAYLSLKSGESSSVASYKMWVDTADYPIDKFDSMDSGDRADLAAVISHEMTHLVMYDTVTSGMLGTFPKWFEEGMAQTTSGDNGWMSSYLHPSSTTDNDIKVYKSWLLNMPYGAGYAACMYLGQVASGESEVNSTNIAKGLDKLLSDYVDLVHEKGNNSSGLFDEAIKKATNGVFESLDDFQNKFTNYDDTDSLDFMHKLLAARGEEGGGSILGELSASEEDVFGTVSGSYGSYKINKDNTWHSNAFGVGYRFPEGLPSTGSGPGGGSDGGGGNDRDGFILQVGSEKDNEVYVKQFNISSDSLFGNMTMDVSTTAGAKASIELAKSADAKISAVRSYYGAMQNRLEHTIRNLDNIVENTTAADSRIRDTDMAAEMVEYSKENILEQAGQAMLAQANQSKQGILTLLG